MRELFNVSELVRVGIEDETSGVAFYSALARKTQSASLRKLYSTLTDQERYHKARFEEMLDTLGTHSQKEEYPGEYRAYLEALTGGRAFPDERTAVAMAAECKDDQAALDLASRFERDTLILMSEMGALLPAQDRDIVKEMAREEQSHLVMLTEARKGL